MKQKGFTLIEAVVATSVFAFVIVSVLAVYVSGIQLDRKSRSQRAVAQNARFIMEFLAKEIRNGTINYASYVSDASGTTDLFLEDPSKQIEHFFLSGNNLILNKNSADTNLNSSGVKVTNVQFFIRPTTDPYLSIGSANEQPHVTITLGLTSNYGSQQTEVAKLDLQSTYATRAYPSRLIGGARVTGFELDTGGSLTFNLLSYWKLDELSGNRDDSKGTNNLFQENPPLGAVAGVKGNAADFPATVNGAPDDLMIPDNAGLSPGDNDFTIASWVKFDANNKNMGIIGKSDGGGGQHEYLLHLDHDWGCCGGDRLIWSVSKETGSSNLRNPLSSVISNIGTPVVGQWYFVVVWHDSVNNQLGIQVNNGAPAITSYSEGLIDSSSAFVLGNNRDVSGMEFDGKLDEVGFWLGRVLTAQEKTDLWNDGNGNTYVP